MAIVGTPTIYESWDYLGIDVPTNKWVYSIKSQEINLWIEKQPIHMWKYYDVAIEVLSELSLKALYGTNYVFTPEMEVWFKLRWS
jgi:hypothetical protein